MGDGLMLSDEMAREAGGSPEVLVLVSALMDVELADQAQVLIQALAARAATTERVDQLLQSLAQVRALGAQLSHNTCTLLQIALELASQQGLISPVRAGDVSGVGNPSAGLSVGSPVPGGIMSALAHRGDHPSSEPWLAASDAPLVQPQEESGSSLSRASDSSVAQVVQGSGLAEVLDDVAQNQRENCGATSIIKSMMLTFRDDPRGPMQIELLPDGGYRVTMRDGYQTTLTAGQVDEASVATDYVGDNPEEVQRANVMMAAAASRYAEVNGISYGEALTRLNGRNHPPDVGYYFGVKVTELPDPNDLSAFEGESVIIVSNGEHAALVADTDEGPMQDNYGDATPYTGNIWAGPNQVGPPTHAYQIRDVSGEQSSRSTSRLSASAFKAISRSVVPMTSRPTDSASQTGSTRPRPRQAAVPREVKKSP